MPIGGGIGHAARVVRIALSAGNRREIEQHPHVVLPRPLEGAVHIVHDGDIDLGLSLRAEGVPRDGQTHGVKADRRHATEIVFGDKCLVVLANALVVRNGAHSDLEFDLVRGAGRSKQRGRHPWLWDEPSR